MVLKYSFFLNLNEENISLGQKFGLELTNIRIQVNGIKSEEVLTISFCMDVMNQNK